MLKRGDVVGSTSGRQWKVRDLLGSGTCCEVYQCSYIGESTQGAIKIYKKGPGYEGAHDREVLLLELVQKVEGACPYLTKVLDDFRHKGHTCLVEELLEANIRQIIYKNNCEGLSLYVIHRLARDIIKGLQYLHEIGFVHGDLKPTNLLWSPQDNTLKIIDFGLSFHKDDQDVNKLQSAGYRAPEVEAWNKKCTQLDKHSAKIRPGLSSDIWSVGCILAEMFQGRKVFTSHTLETEAKNRTKAGPDEGMNVEQSIVTHIFKPRDSDDQDEAEEIVKNLQDLISKCLDSKMELRQSAAEALKHPFFQHKLEPSFKDLLLLPSCILRLLNMLEGSRVRDDQEDYEDLVLDIKEECEKYGAVKQCLVPKEGEGKTKVYVEYQDGLHSMAAFEGLTGKTFNGRTVLVTYFPKADFEKANYF